MSLTESALDCHAPAQLSRTLARSPRILFVSSRRSGCNAPCDTASSDELTAVELSGREALAAKRTKKNGEVKHACTVEGSRGQQLSYN